MKFTNVNRNVLFLFLITGFLLLIPFVLGQTAGLPEGFQEGDLLDVNKITTFSNPQSWQNLSSQWREKLFESPVVSLINSVFSSVNFIFLILFGVNYSFSLLLFFIIILWIWFFMQFNRVFRFSIFQSKGLPLIISLGITIVLAQVGLYKGIANLFVKLIFLPEKPWLGIFVFLAIMFVLFILGNINKIIAKIVKKNKKLSEEQKEMINRGLLETFTGKLKEGFDK